MKPKLKCVIYTRKSTNDGLEQDFNSLDAQREACEAYIKSQAHEGWTCRPDKYDDGAYSGATLDRPAMQSLLEKVKAGEIDVIVVYKVDRLTRSLTDFAKLVELFDTHKVSFVSVTQQFNTTSSIGRLTLNVLLSFAQFEREVTAERIRDKIAASRKKGKWMGGSVPMGYDVRDKRLVPNNAEAKDVRKIFELYLEIGNIRSLLIALKAEGTQPKTTKQNGGKTDFSRGQLAHLLKNPVYIGKARHKDKVYEGEHEAILPQELFNQVQTKLRAQAPFETIKYREKEPFLLRGLLYDADGRPFTTSHSNKKGKRYHYYMTRPKDGEPNTKVWRLPVDHVDNLMLQSIKTLLKDPNSLKDLFGIAEPTSEEWFRFAAAEHLAASDIKLDIIQSCLNRIDLSPEILTLTFDLIQLAKVLRIESTIVTKGFAKYKTPIHLQSRSVGTKLQLQGASGPKAEPDPNIIRLIAKAYHWFELLKNGKAHTINEIASQEQVHASDITRYLTLAFLNPLLVEHLIASDPPLNMTSNSFKHLVPTPSRWVEQEAQLHSKRG